ncbi:MAG: phytanoyl-CoA dioxygenase family protein [Allosphingosinicella sp.]
MRRQSFAAMIAVGACEGPVAPVEARIVVATSLRADFPDHVADYMRDGFAVVRNFFSASEIETIAAATDQIHAEGLRHGRCFRHGNLFYNVAPANGDGPPRVRMVQWPSYHQPALDAVRLDPRFAELLAPLIGNDLKQIINQIHWKAPGNAGDFAWHQDSRFREPASVYRRLASSYVQTGLAIDPHTPFSGGMRFVPGSHARRDLGLDRSASVLGNAMDDAVLERAGLDPDGVVDLVLEPGDLALWNPYLVHGSGPNHSGHGRRLYINGYVRAADCDRGEWAFRGGRPVPLGPEPALVHYEALRERGDPHYP